MDTGAWRQAGLYDPDAPNAQERLALLEYLSARGATIDQMVEAMRLDALPAVAGDLIRLTERSAESIEELAARCGASVEMVQRVLLAAGLPVDATTRLPENLDALISAVVQGVALMGERPILAFTRVIGAAAITIAEAAVALFHSELGPGSTQEGRDELSRAHQSERATLAFTAVPEAINRVLLTQFNRAVHRAVVVRGWSAGHEVGVPDSEIVALGFVDLVGSTAWSAGLGLREQSLALSRFESAAWSAAVLGGGRVIKMIGDEAFFSAPSVDVACEIAAEVCRVAGDDAVLPPARAAVGKGLARAREGDYFGPVVNLISRLVKVATPGSIVVTKDAASELDAARWVQRPLGPQSLRGLDAAVDAVELHARTRLLGD